MIWHIFRKDWKLLWKAVIGVALVNILYRAVLARDGPFADFADVEHVLFIISLVATAVLVIMAVQQDAIPGLRQDWLVRPLPRKDLLLSKLLFVVLLVRCPIILADIGQGLAAGFPIGQTLAAALSKNLCTFLALDLPLAAFATLTRNLTEAMGATLMVALGCSLIGSSSAFNMTIAQNRGAGWVATLAQAVWGLLAVAVILGLQYYRRKTTAARSIFGAAAVVWMLAELIPWQPAFAIEERFSRAPSAANDVSVAFEPAFGRISRLQTELFHDWFRSQESRTYLYVPLRIGGLADGPILNVDQAITHIVVPGEAPVELWRGLATVVWRSNQVWQQMAVPLTVYNRLKDRPVQLKIDYSLTLLQPDPLQYMPALGGHQAINDLGQCATRISPGFSVVEVGCLAPGNFPCVEWFLDNPRTGRQNRPELSCTIDYAPFIDQLAGGSTVRSISRPRFAYPEQHLHYDVDGSQLQDARVAIRVFRPEAHFTRHVVIPDIRLGDWTPQF